LVQLSKTMPREATLNDPFTFEMRASAAACAGNVVITDTVPEGLTYVSSDPPASVSGNTLTWTIGDLDAGANRVMKVTVRATKEGTFTNCAIVKADPRVCGQTFVGKPALAIEKSGPATANLGADVAYTVIVKNTGTAVAKNVSVSDKVPAGLGGVREIPFPIGDLAPGQSRTINVPLKATERGRHCNVAVATSSNAGTVQDDACTLVVQAGVKLVKTGDAEQFITKEAKYRITASNTGDVDLTNVVVTDNAPSQTRIVNAANATVSGNTATWNVGTLKPGESKNLDLVLTSSQPGRWCNSATITTQQGLRETAEACTLWKGVPAVLLELLDDPDPVPVGGTTTYTIRITNQGNADLINVNLVAQFPSQFTPVSSQGGTIDGKTVKFPTTPRMTPKQIITYSIVGRAVEAGDSRVKLTLTEDQLSGPVVEEESTRGF